MDRSDKTDDQWRQELSISHEIDAAVARVNQQVLSDDLRSPEAAWPRRQST